MSTPSQSTTDNRDTWRSRRLALLLFLAYAALVGQFQGIQNILVPAAVERLAPHSKVSTLAVLSTLSAITTVIALLAGGWVSDRTRSRWGKRTPSLVIACAACVGLSLLLAIANSIAGLMLAMPLLWFAANFYQTVLIAILPDRVEEKHRGFVSAAIALGVPVGIFEGVNIAAHAPSPLVGHALLALILVLATAALVLTEREQSSRTIVAAGKDLDDPGISLMRTLGERDFLLAFVSRFLLFLAYFTVGGYLFYVMQDYVGRGNLPDGNPGNAVSIVLSVVTIAWLIITPLTGIIADRVGHTAGVVGFTSIAIGAALLIPAFTNSWNAMLLFGVGMGLTFGIYFAIDLKLVSMVLPSAKTAGRDIGIMNIAASGPTVFAPALAAAIIQYASFPALFVAGAALACVGGMVAFPIKVRSHRHTPSR